MFAACLGLGVWCHWDRVERMAYQRGFAAGVTDAVKESRTRVWSCGPRRSSNTRGYDYAQFLVGREIRKNPKLYVNNREDAVITFLAEHPDVDQKCLVAAKKRLGR